MVRARPRRSSWIPGQTTWPRHACADHLQPDAADRANLAFGVHRAGTRDGLPAGCCLVRLSIRPSVYIMPADGPPMSSTCMDTFIPDTS